MVLAPEWVVLLPLGGGLLVFLIRGRAAPTVGVLTALVTVGAAAGVAQRVWRHGPEQHPVGGWDAPLGIVLYTDGLAALMLAMTASVMGLVSLYAFWYYRKPHEDAHPGNQGWSESRGFWPLWLFLFAALNALFLSGDIFNLYVTLERLTSSKVT